MTKELSGIVGEWKDWELLCKFALLKIGLNKRSGECVSSLEIEHDALIDKRDAFIDKYFDGDYSLYLANEDELRFCKGKALADKYKDAIIQVAKEEAREAELNRLYGVKASFEKEHKRLLNEYWDLESRSTLLSDLSEEEKARDKKRVSDALSDVSNKKEQIRNQIREEKDKLNDK